MWVLFLRILTEGTSENLYLSNLLNNSGTSQNREGKFGQNLRRGLLNTSKPYESQLQTMNNKIQLNSVPSRHF